MKNIAIIPARGGSKRIPRKNIKPFMGKPIMAYSIEAALKSNLFDVVMVSTDDEEIADIARQYGAEVPFMRSKSTSNDSATLSDVLKEVISAFKNRGAYYDNMCCILATAPLISSVDIQRGYDKLLDNDSISVLYPIVQFSYPVQRCIKLGQDGEIAMKWPEYQNARSQDLEKLYHDSGTFYWYKIKPWLAGNVKRSGVVIDEHYVQDIDTEEDWLLAELKYQYLNGNKTDGIIQGGRR